MEEFNILYYFRIINKWKFFIIVLALLAAFTTMAAVLRAPSYYSATAVVFLPETQQMGFSPSAFGFSGAGIIRGVDNKETLITVLLQSKRMAKDIAVEFSIKERFYVSTMDGAINIVKGMMRIEPLPSITLIKIRTRDPKLSADIANFCAHNLNKLNAELELASEKPLVKVLDEATPPLYPEPRYAKRKTAVSFILGAFLGCLMAFFVEYIQHLKKKEISDK